MNDLPLTKDQLTYDRAFISCVYKQALAALELKAKVEELEKENNDLVTRNLEWLRHHKETEVLQSQLEKACKALDGWYALWDKDIIGWEKGEPSKVSAHAFSQILDKTTESLGMYKLPLAKSESSGISPATMTCPCGDRNCTRNACGTKDGYWWCPKCEHSVSDHYVTDEPANRHIDCGTAVEWKDWPNVPKTAAHDLHNPIEQSTGNSKISNYETHGLPSLPPVSVEPSAEECFEWINNNRPKIDYSYFGFTSKHVWKVYAFGKEYVSELLIDAIRSAMKHKETP